MASNVLGEYKTTLDRLGRSSVFLQTLLSLGTAVAEVIHINCLVSCLSDHILPKLHPITKAVLACVNVLYKVRSRCTVYHYSTSVQHLEDGDLRHKSLLDLVENMACTIAYMEDVEQFARLEELKEAIKNVQPLVEETTNFVLKYSSTGELRMFDPSTHFLTS